MVTNTFLSAIAGAMFGKTGTVPENYYIGVSTSNPATTATEPTGNGYARKSVANSSANFNNASNGVVTNKADISFAESTGAGWGTVTHYVVYDAASAGNLLEYGELSVSRTVEAGTTLTIKAGQMSFTVANPA